MEDNGLIVGGRHIGQNHPPFIIAEMSGNHNQSLERALAIVDAAADSGVHALKIQTYTADTMTLDLDGDGFSITDSGSLWKGTFTNRRIRRGTGIGRFSTAVASGALSDFRRRLISPLSISSNRSTPRCIKSRRSKMPICR